MTRGRGRPPRVVSPHGRVGLESKRRCLTGFTRRKLKGDATGPSVDPIAQQFVPFEVTDDPGAVAWIGWQVRLHFFERLEHFFDVLDPTTGWIRMESGSFGSGRVVPATLIGFRRFGRDAEAGGIEDDGTTRKGLRASRPPPYRWCLALTR